MINVSKKRTFIPIMVFTSINAIFAQASLPELDAGVNRILEILNSSPVQVITTIVITFLALMLIVKRDSKQAIIGILTVMGGVILIKSAPTIVSYIWGS